MTDDLTELLVSPESSLRGVMRRIDHGSRGIALVVDPQRRFVATVTDGDVRRAILAGASLDAPVTAAMTDKSGRPRRSVTVPVGTCLDEQRKLMRRHDIRHLPLLDAKGRVAGLATLDQMEENAHLPLQAVIMAGGFGKRLRPLTDSTPKPMLPIGGRPLMERTIENLRDAGIRRINITTHYLPHKITDYFGRGTRHGVQLNYVSEDQPLGTAGALSLVEETEESLLVINGDILTRVDFRDFFRFHRDRRAELTVGTRHYEVQLPYGILDAENGVVKRLREKPKHAFLVNAGVYIVEPSVKRIVPGGQEFHMTDLIAELLRRDRPVACFPIVEYWLDIGRHDDFQQAQRDVHELKRAS